MRLRQIALVAAELAPVEADLCSVLGLVPCYRDPGVARWGLINAVMPLGDEFLEVVSPSRPGTSAGRYLERRGDDGGYMVILQDSDALPWRRRLEAEAVRAVATADRPDYCYSHFHPADTGGILLSIDSASPPYADRGPCPWPPAGPDYRPQGERPAAGGLRAAEMQSADPAAMAAHWSRLLDRPLVRGAGGDPELRLGNATLRFTPATDGRGAGLKSIEIALADPAAALTRAQARGLKRTADRVEIGGLGFRLLAAEAPDPDP